MYPVSKFIVVFIFPVVQKYLPLLFILVAVVNEDKAILFPSKYKFELIISYCSPADDTLHSSKVYFAPQ